MIQKVIFPRHVDHLDNENPKKLVEGEKKTTRGIDVDLANAKSKEGEVGSGRGKI